MFDIGWLELMVIGVVALIVVGPKDLPGMFRTVGQFVGKARGMAREFQRSMEAAADESGLKEAADTMKGLDPLDQTKASMKNYAKSYVTQKDKKDAAAKAETKGEALVKEASKIASPAAKATAPAPTVIGEPEVVVHNKPKAAPKKPAGKKAPAKSTAKAATKTASKAATKKPATKKPATKKPAAKPKAKAAAASKAKG